VSQQSNGYDCGVYVLKFIDQIIKDYPASTSSIVHSKFDQIFSRRDISSDEVSELREEMKATIEK
jgi:hypothetical protein